MEAIFEKAESYEDLISGKFCTNCFHLIEDHFKFEFTGDVSCCASETIDGFFKACECKVIGHNFNMTFTKEDFETLKDEENDADELPDIPSKSISFGRTTFTLTK